MKINAMGLLLCTVLIGCGSGDAPFGDGPIDQSGDGTIDSDRELPPGTAAPKPNDSIFRSEPEGSDTSGGDSGDGFATGVRYDSQSDTFFVDNLAFDGGDDTPYNRGSLVSSLGSNSQYAVYEAVDQYPDAFSEQPINQFTHRAVYGVSNSGETEFAIIRTGAYIGYGFGGFVYERNGSVELPTSGQALYTGQGSGLRDFQDGGGLEYITADVQVAIDFDDFNGDPNGTDPGAVRGVVFNQRIFDIAGNDITQGVVDNINEVNSAGLSGMPRATFVIGPGAIDTNGEMTGDVISSFSDLEGNSVDYANEGKYYGILSGENADELVGVVVIESRAESDVTGARNTIGFILDR